MSSKLSLHKRVFAMPISQRLTARAHPVRSNRSKGKNLCTRTERFAVYSCAETTAVPSKATLDSQLEECLEELRMLPPSEKAVGNLEASIKVKDILGNMKEGGYCSLYDSLSELERRTVYPRQLAECGINNPSELAVGSVRNDAAFFGTVVIGSSLLAVIAGFLPGDWGFWGMYFSGGISIVTLAIGSTAPGLLDVIINKFSLVFPDYRERTLKHEAAHFLIAYLLGVPVTGYSLDLGKEHTDFAEAKLQRRMAGGSGLETSQVNVLAVICMAGVAAEGLNYDKVIGQNGDLRLLQRILRRSEVKMNDTTQMDVTRWAVFQAAEMLKENDAAYVRLMEAMKNRASVPKCIEAIESA